MIGPHTSSADAARALLGGLASGLYDQLAAIASDEDDATKLDRAAALLSKTTPELSAIVVLALLAAVQDCEDRLALHNVTS